MAEGGLNILVLLILSLLLIGIGLYMISVFSFDVLKNPYVFVNFLSAAMRGLMIKALALVSKYVGFVFFYMDFLTYLGSPLMALVNYFGQGTLTPYSSGFFNMVTDMADQIPLVALPPKNINLGKVDGDCGDSTFTSYQFYTKAGELVKDCWYMYLSGKGDPLFGTKYNPRTCYIVNFNTKDPVSLSGILYELKGNYEAKLELGPFYAQEKEYNTVVPLKVADDDQFYDITNKGTLYIKYADFSPYFNGLLFQFGAGANNLFRDYDCGIYESPNDPTDLIYVCFKPDRSCKYDYFYVDKGDLSIHDSRGDIILHVYYLSDKSDPGKKVCFVYNGNVYSACFNNEEECDLYFNDIFICNAAEGDNNPEPCKLIKEYPINSFVGKEEALYLTSGSVNEDYFHLDTASKCN